MTYKDWKLKADARKAERIIDKHFDNLSTAYAKQDLRAIDRVYNRGTGKTLNTRKIKPVTGSKIRGSVYAALNNYNGEARTINKVERAITRELELSRSTYQDFYEKTGHKLFTTTKEHVMGAHVSEHQ